MDHFKTRSTPRIPGVWYCVGTQVACELWKDMPGDQHWTNQWPTTNGGKPRWKAMMQQPAERLLSLLEANGISDNEHCCPICPDQHQLWANRVAGPMHYQHLHRRGNLQDSLRWQGWDLPNMRRTKIVGRLMFDHLTGLIMMLRSDGRPSNEATYPMATISRVVVPYTVQDHGQNPTDPERASEVPSSAGAGPRGCSMGEVPPNAGEGPRGCGMGNAPPSAGAMPHGCGIGEVPPSAGVEPRGCGMGNAPPSAGAMPHGCGIGKVPPSVGVGPRGCGMGNAPPSAGAMPHGCGIGEVPLSAGVGPRGCGMGNAPPSAGAMPHGCGIGEVPPSAGVGPRGCGRGNAPPSAGAMPHGCGIGEVPPSAGAMSHGCGIGEVPPSVGVGPRGCGMGNAPPSAGAMPHGGLVILGLFMNWGLVKLPRQAWQDAGQNPEDQRHESEVPQSAGAKTQGCGMGGVPPSAGAMPTQEYAEFWRSFQRMQPQSLFAEYTDPGTGKSWWYDLVTGGAVWSRPKGFIILNNQAEA
eukprot:s370_g1.t1